MSSVRLCLFFAFVVCGPINECIGFQSQDEDSAATQSEAEKKLTAELERLAEIAGVRDDVKLTNLLEEMQNESSVEERIKKLEQLQKDGRLRLGGIPVIPPDPARNSGSGDRTILILVAILIGGFLVIQVIGAVVKETTSAPKVRLLKLQERLSSSKSIDDTEMEEFLMAVTYLERANRWGDALILLKDIQKVLTPASEHWNFVANKIEELDPGKTRN